MTPSRRDGGAILVVVYAPDVGKRLDLDLDRHQPMTIGSAAGNDLVIDEDWGVAAVHARIERREGAWWIVALDHDASLRVRGRPARVEKLGDRDEIRVGRAMLLFIERAAEEIESAYHEAMYQLFTKDPVTGTHNKRYFMIALDREVTHFQRTGHPVAVLAIRADRLRGLIHDVHRGFAFELLLERLAERLFARLWAEDAVIARVREERLAVILPDTDLTRALTVAEDLRARVEAREILLDNEAFRMTISVGVAQLGERASADANTVIDAANEALEHAKRQGGNGVCSVTARL